MPRQLTPEAAQAILARETGEAFLAYLVISGEGLETMRLINNTEPVTRGGLEYTPFSFAGDPPDDTGQRSPTVELRIDNVDKEITRLIRDYTGIPECEIGWIMASQPDNVVHGPFAFSILSAQYDEMVISVNLGYEEDFLNQAIPAQTYSPSNSAGLFV
ncbi:MAG: DUF1833 domain-containing protein [Gammaproteobacteria bacterium]|nr:DUF1833 domain-containing protein [Gammaproteobacteria bacterium]